MKIASKGRCVTVTPQGTRASGAVQPLLEGSAGGLTIRGTGNIGSNPRLARARCNFVRRMAPHSPRIYPVGDNRLALWARCVCEEGARICLPSPASSRFMKPATPIPSPLRKRKPWLSVFLGALFAGTPLVPGSLAQGAGPKPGDWAVTGRETLPSSVGLEARLVKLSPRRPDLPPATVHLVVFDPRQYTLRVVDSPPQQEGNLRETMEKLGALAGVNGGYFHPDHTPLGLVVSGGKVLHEQESAKLLSGLVVATAKDLRLMRPSEFRLGNATREALQTGPFLVDGGAPVAGLNDTKAARRTVAVALADGRWALVSLSPVTLAQAGAMLSGDALDWPGGTQATRALNLDGGSSTGFYLRPPEVSATARPLYLAEFGRVRNFLALVPRN